MAQVAQVGTGRNTDHNSPVKRSKSRNCVLHSIITWKQK